ncbi:MAG: hypothetical protein ACKO96_10490 [Flammeovirgaceae bacterium]
MKLTAVALSLLTLYLVSCQKSEQISEFTGNQVTYSLQPGSQYPISGTVTLKEKKDGNTYVLVDLVGTSGDVKYPVHLHLGDLSENGAPVAALLSPLAANAGKSETTVSQLADETKINYQDFIKMKACIKVHLSDSGPSKDIILAAGNIGASVAAPNGRAAVGVCSSN